MPAWKVLLVGFFGVLCLALVAAIIVVPFAYTGGQRWGWLGGLVGGLLVVGTLFVLFLRSASRAMDAKPSRRG
jgi:hypothetical protein